MVHHRSAAIELQSCRGKEAWMLVRNRAREVVVLGAALAGWLSQAVAAQPIPRWETKVLTASSAGQQNGTIKLPTNFFGNVVIATVIGGGGGGAGGAGGESREIGSGGGGGGAAGEHVTVVIDTSVLSSKALSYHLGSPGAGGGGGLAAGNGYAGESGGDSLLLQFRAKGGARGEPGIFRGAGGAGGAGGNGSADAGAGGAGFRSDTNGPGNGDGCHANDGPGVAVPGSGKGGQNGEYTSPGVAGGGGGGAGCPSILAAGGDGQRGQVKQENSFRNQATGGEKGSGGGGGGGAQANDNNMGGSGQSGGFGAIILTYQVR